MGSHKATQSLSSRLHPVQYFLYQIKMSSAIATKYTALVPATRASTRSRHVRAGGSRARHHAKRTCVVVCAQNPAPVEKKTSPDAAPKEKKPFAMNFNGFAPETINGRLAQLGFVAAVGAELASGESLSAQFSHYPMAFAL